MPQATVVPNTLGDVKQRVRSLMGDPRGSWITDAYVTPLIQQAYEDITQQLKNGSGKNLEAVIEALDIDAGTSDLSYLQSYGDPTADPIVEPGEWVGLADPIKLWVKMAGQLPAYYSEARGPRDTLPHGNPPGVTPGFFSPRVTWAWIGNKISITPVAGAIDAQLYGRFNPPPLQQDTDPLVIYPKATAPVAYATASLVGVERSNPQVLQGYIERAQATVDNIIADIIRQSQGNPRRLGTIGGSYGNGWGWR
jgi:hypothetical protein